MFYSNVNKIFLGTDGAASSRVGQILPLRVEGSIPYSAPLNNPYKIQIQMLSNYDISDKHGLRYTQYALLTHTDTNSHVVGNSELKRNCWREYKCNGAG